MRVLFLDIDGVLNSTKWYDERPDEPHLGRLSELATMIDPDGVARINRIVEQTGCLLVLSSSWRCMEPLALINRALKHRGLSVPLIGATPSIGNPRGGEIAAWLNAALRGAEWTMAILDDDADMEPWMSCLVQTDGKVGIQDDDVDLAIYLLMQGPSPMWKPAWSPGIRRLER